MRVLAKIAPSIRRSELMQSALINWRPILTDRECPLSIGLSSLIRVDPMTAAGATSPAAVGLEKDGCPPDPAIRWRRAGHQSRLPKTPMIRPAEVHQISGIQPSKLLRALLAIARSMGYAVPI